MASHGDDEQRRGAPATRGTNPQVISHVCLKCHYPTFVAGGMKINYSGSNSQFSIQ